MNNNINFNYLETYSRLFTENICSAYFSTKKFMNGQEIIQLTPSSQINFMVIKTLFEAWRRELEQMKSNPFFDYKDYAVNEALKEFMNVLSRAIKIERVHFEPMMRDAVASSILLAVNPEVFFLEEIENSNAENPTVKLKESKKYIKWHQNIFLKLIDKANSGADKSELKHFLHRLFEQGENQAEPLEYLLSPLNQVIQLDIVRLLKEEDTVDQKIEAENIKEGGKIQENTEKILFQLEESPNLHNDMGLIDPLRAWTKFETEEYAYMKGTIKEMNESIGINQRFMFSRELFEGNADLMKEAFKALDECESFGDAIELLNEKYVMPLNWNLESDEVNELIQMIFRKFGQKN